MKARQEMEEATRLAVTLLTDHLPLIDNIGMIHPKQQDKNEFCRSAFYAIDKLNQVRKDLIEGCWGQEGDKEATDLLQFHV